MTATSNRLKAIDQALSKQQPERYAAGSKSARFSTGSGLISALAARQNSIKKVTDNCDNSYYHNHRIQNTQKDINNRFYLMVYDLIDGTYAMVCKYMYKVVDRINRFLAAENLYVNPTAGIVAFPSPVPALSEQAGPGLPPTDNMGVENIIAQPKPAALEENQFNQRYGGK